MLIFPFQITNQCSEEKRDCIMPFSDFAITNLLSVALAYCHFAVTFADDVTILPASVFVGLSGSGIIIKVTTGC